MSDIDQRRARQILQRLYYLPGLYVLSVEGLIDQLRQEGYEWPVEVVSSQPFSIEELCTQLETVAAVLNAAELHSFSTVSSGPAIFGGHLMLMKESGQLSLRHVPALASEAGIAQLYERAFHRDEKL